MPNYNYNNYQNPYMPGYQPAYNKAPINQYTFVNGIEGAKSYQVLYPNQTMLLMDSDNPICYMKQTDEVGKASIRYFKLEEIDEAKTKEILSLKNNTMIPEYALKSDIDNINNKLAELTKLLKGESKGE